MSFDLVVIGCGGGPSELNLSSYFFKARQLGWEQGILAVEAGSGLGALQDVIASNPRAFDAAYGKRSSVGGPVSPSLRAASTYSLVRTFLISHAHFDHVAGLVIGAGATTSENVRCVAGLPSVIKDLQTIFDGQRLWPRLVRQKNEPKLPFAYVYDPIAPSAAYHNVSPSLSTQLYPISHGSTTMGTYDSTAFFIRNDFTAHEFLFLGDVEPDSISSNPRNRIVWTAAASRIIAGRLGHIFLECSYRKGRGTDELFGHLSPEHVYDEIKTLAKEVVRIRRGAHSPTSNGSTGGGTSGGVWSRTRRKRRSTVGSMTPYPNSNSLPPPFSIPDAELRGTLDGLTLVVIHCKEPMPPDEPPDDIRGVIRDEIDDILKPLDLGLTIIVARQGMCLAF